MEMQKALDEVSKNPYKKNEQEAQRLFQQGLRHMTGDGVERSEEKAVLLYHKALVLCEDAQIDHEIGNSYCLGIGVNRDPEMAKQFIRRGTLLYPETLETLIRLEIETKEMEAALYYGQFLSGQDPDLSAELRQVRTGGAEGRKSSRQCVEQLRKYSLYAAGDSIYHYAVNLLETLLDTGSSILDYKINQHLNCYAEDPMLMRKDAVFWAVMAEQFTDGNVELQVSVSMERGLSAALLSLACSYHPEGKMPLPEQPWQQTAPELQDAIRKIRGGSFSRENLNILRRYADAGSYHAASELQFLVRYVDSEREAGDERLSQLREAHYPPMSKNCLLMAAAALQERDPECCFGLARMLDGDSTGDLQSAPAAALLTGVYFIWTVRLYEQRISQGDLRASYQLAKVYESSLLGDDESCAKWMMEGVKKRYAPSVMDVVDNEAVAKSVAQESFYQKHNVYPPAPLMDLAQSVPDTFYRKEELIETVSNIKDMLRKLANQLYQDQTARLRSRLRAEEKEYRKHLDRQERGWNFFLRGYDLTAEEWAAVDLAAGNTEGVNNYVAYKTFVRDVKEKKNSEKIRRELLEEDAARRAEQRTERGLEAPEIKGRLSAAGFPEPRDRDRWIEESGLGDTARLLERLEPFDYDRANEQYRLSEGGKTTEERYTALQAALRLGHKAALYKKGKLLEAAQLWYGPALCAYYLRYPDTKLGREMLRRGVFAEDEASEFEQANLLIGREGHEKEGALLFQKLSNQDVPEAKEALADCFYRGIGVPEDPNAAVMLLEEAAKKGSPSACAKLASFYEAGLNGTPDIQKALMWYNRAIGLGWREAFYRLALLYLEGKSVERSFSQGIMYCVQGVLANDMQCRKLFHSLDGEAAGDLNRWYRKPEPVKKKFKLFHTAAPEEKAFEKVLREKKKKGKVGYSEELVTAAEGGITEAQELLAEIYISENSAHRNLKEAFRLYSRAAEQGSPLALERMAWWFDSGVDGFHNEKLARLYARLAQELGGREYGSYWNLGAPQGKTDYAVSEDKAELYLNLGRAYKGDNEKTAFDNFLLSAKAGHPLGQLETGYRYNIGLGVKQNLIQAVYWFRRSSDQGNAQAMFNLGTCYENGQGVSADQEEAFRWYERAAQAGNSNGQTHAGYRYHYGLGVARDIDKAVYWYKKAVEQNNAEAMQLLGVCYANGEGVTADLTAAFLWYERSARAGHLYGQEKLGECYEKGQGTSKNLTMAASWFRKSAEQGCVTAMYRLGEYYENGWGVEQNEEQAVYWYRKSAEQGNDVAMCNIGLCYEYGRGVEKNPETAVAWFQKAVGKNFARGKYLLAKCLLDGTGITADRESALALLQQAAKQDYTPAQKLLDSISAG